MNKKINVCMLVIVLLGATANISCDRGSDDALSPEPGGSALQVWTSYKWNPLKGRYDNYQFVIFPNNDCLDYLPEGGLLGLSKSTDTASGRIWGKAVDKDGELHLEFSNGTVRKLGKISDTKVSYPPGSTSTYYYRSKSVNELKIDGAYSPDPQLYELYQSTAASSVVPGQQGRAIIFFKKDGTYYNEGISYSNITYGDNTIYGDGTYEMKDFSLVLTTAKGRTWQMAFTGIQDFDPAADQSGFMINGIVNYRLGNNIYSLLFQGEENYES